METSPLLEKKSGQYAFLTTKGESGAIGKERSRNTCQAAHVSATPDGSSEKTGVARRQTPMRGQRRSGSSRQASPRRLRSRNQGTQRADGRMDRMRTRRQAGYPRTHDTLRHIHQDHRNKNRRFARSKLPRRPCSRRRQAPRSSSICQAFPCRGLNQNDTVSARPAMKFQLWSQSPVRSYIRAASRILRSNTKSL